MSTYVMGGELSGDCTWLGSNGCQDSFIYEGITHLNYSEKKGLIYDINVLHEYSYRSRILTILTPLYKK